MIPKLMNLLYEKRDSLIHHTVTKGLNSNVTMKDSKIEGVGKIPKHWDVEPLKFHVKINENTLDNKTDPLLKISYIDIGSVHAGGKMDESELMLFSESPSRARRIVKENDSIVSTVRTYLKAISFIDGKHDNHICSTGFAVLSPSKRLEPKFFYWLISSPKYIDAIMANSEGVTYPAINPTKIERFPCILPPKQEQKDISDFLDQKISKIDLILENIPKNNYT